MLAHFLLTETSNIYITWFLT